MSRPTTSASWVRGIMETLAAEGLDVGGLCHAAGIDVSALDAAGARVATEKISRLWELAVEHSRNPAIGLAQSHVVRPANFDVVGYTMMSCSTLLAGFERLLRYLRILSDGITIDMRQESGGYRVVVDLLESGSRPIPRQRIEFILVTLANFCRWVTGRNIRLLEVELAYPGPSDLRPYAEAFQCRLVFDAARNSVLFPLADVTAPLPTSNPLLAALHEQFAGDYLQHFDQTRVSHRARQLIIQQLPDGEPRRDETARALCMSERTLQRRLEDEGTSFHDLLDETRRELAEQYLGRLHLSLAEAAYLLGFADQSSFSRACKRWFELSPGQYRDELRKHWPVRPGTSHSPS
jgi:AraC-like DNA-binding protein